MTLESIRRWCLALPGVTEDVKWDDDLVFSVGGKMFCVAMLDPPHRLSFKCDDETFADDVTRERIRQIEVKAIRKLKHPSRSKWLREFIEKP